MKTFLRLIVLAVLAAGSHSIAFGQPQIAVTKSEVTSLYADITRWEKEHPAPKNGDSQEQKDAAKKAFHVVFDARISAALAKSAELNIEVPVLAQNVLLGWPWSPVMASFLEHLQRLSNLL